MNLSHGLRHCATINIHSSGATTFHLHYALATYIYLMERIKKTAQCFSINFSLPNHQELQKKISYTEGTALQFKMFRCEIKGERKKEQQHGTE